jgi:hypothetical protein
VNSDFNAVVNGPVTYINGKRSKAISGENCCLVYKSKKELLAENGTLELWVMPIAWD